MKSTLTPFNFGQSIIRTIKIGDAVWFVCTDIAEALGYRNAPDASRHLDNDEKGTQIVRTLGGDQEVTIINESGLYALVLRSRKPEARKFAKWVTGEVLPAIRKTGNYSAAPELPAPSLLGRRWLVSYDGTGKEQVTPLAAGAAVVNPSNSDELAAFLHDMVPQHLLGEALATLTGRTLSLLNHRQRETAAAAGKPLQISQRTTA